MGHVMRPVTGMLPAASTPANAAHAAVGRHGISPSQNWALTEALVLRSVRRVARGRSALRSIPRQRRERDPEGIVSVGNPDVVFMGKRF